MTSNNEKDKVIIRPMVQADTDGVLAGDKLMTGKDRSITFTRPLTLNHLVQEMAFGFVAELKGKIVGFVSGVITKTPGEPDVAWIYIAGVLPGHRHQNIGARLGEAFFEHCRKQGIKSVRINVDWGDSSLLTWLGTMGFGLSLGKIVEFEKPL